MTPQEIFDTVAKHLFAQGRRAGIPHRDYGDNDGFSCRYRTLCGSMCAVGKLIPDTAYDPRMEGLGVDGLFEAGFGASLPRWMWDNYPLLDRLQMVHDQKDHWIDDKRMRWELSLAAQAYGLDDSILLGLSFNRPEGQDA